MAKQNAGRALEAKIASVVALTLILHDSNLEQIQAQLHHITNGQKDYFDNDLAVIELGIGAEAAEAMDWQALIALLRDWSLNPVAVRHAPAALHKRLRTLGLSLDEIAARPDAAAELAKPAAAKSTPAGPGGPAQSELALSELALSEPALSEPALSEPAVSEPAASESAPSKSVPAKSAPSGAQSSAAPAAPAATVIPGPAATASKPCMMVDTPVRGGQRIYARGADLVVTAIVNPGAELIADGSIHVYAPLRGRALAGAAGDTGARIFALEMAPELVSIAGIYRTFEDGPPPGLGKSPAEVRLEGDRLDLRAIGERGKN